MQSVWKRALKDRFKYVRRTIEDDEQVLRNKCKFGHRRGQRRKSSSAENKPYDIKVLTEVRLVVLIFSVQGHLAPVLPVRLHPARERTL